MPYAHMSSLYLRQELYEQPRWLFVAWKHSATQSAPLQWAFFVAHAENTVYGMVYQIVKNAGGNASDKYRIDMSPGQRDMFAGLLMVSRITLRVEGAFAPSSYGGLVLDEVNERNTSGASKANCQDWIIWMVECLERNQLVDVGSADKVRARVPR